MLSLHYLTMGLCISGNLDLTISPSGCNIGTLPLARRQNRHEPKIATGNGQRATRNVSTHCALLIAHCAFCCVGGTSSPHLNHWNGFGASWSYRKLAD